MRSILIIALTLLSINSYADLGFCFEYKVNFYFKDSTNIEAYFYWSSYFDSIKEIATLDPILERNFRMQDSLTIYTELHQLTMLSNSLDGVFEYYAVKKGDKRKIANKDLLKTEIITCEPCCYKKGTEGYKHYFFCSNQVIKELNEFEINALQNKKPVISYEFEHWSLEWFGAIVVACYNEDMDKASLDKMLLDLFCEQSTDKESHSAKSKDERYKA